MNDRASTIPVLLAAAAALALVGLAGCEKEPAEKVGDATEQTVEKAQENLSEAKESVSDAVEKAGDKIEKATD